MAGSPFSRGRHVRRRRLVPLIALGLGLVLLAGAATAWRLGYLDRFLPRGGDPPVLLVKGTTPDREPGAPVDEELGLRWAGDTTGPINRDFEGLTTFRGNAARAFYGVGPVPEDPEVLWRFPRNVGMCMESDTGVPGDLKVWCGMGWTGQPNVIERPDGRVELRFGAYDGRYHFLDAATGQRIRDDVVTGDLTKGSATTDPVEPDLYYGGSRDDFLRVMALDRDQPEVLWAVDADTSVPEPRWNDDWDGAPLVVGDHLLEGGENSWFYVIKLNRGHDGQGHVTVDPQIVLTVPSWDDELLSKLDDEEPRLSIESSVAYFDGVAYFSNSAGLVQGWDISGILGGGGPDTAEQVFRFWTGDDTDATITIDDRGFLYVGSELERFNVQAANNGQLMKLDPRNPDDPLVWSIAVTEEGQDGNGGLFSTPALAGGYLYATTNAGSLIAVRADDGHIAWRIELPDPTWSSPVVVDDVLVVGDCAGVLHGYDVSKPDRYPTELWRVQLDGCIEATPAIWKGRIYVGTREGPIYALGDR